MLTNAAESRLVRDLRADKHDAIGGGISRKVDA